MSRPVVVGHSLGGVLALGVAASAPDAVGAVGAVDGVPFLQALTNPKTRAADMTPLADQMKAMLGALSPAQLDAQAGATALAQVPDTAHMMRVTALVGIAPANRGQGRGRDDDDRAAQPGGGDSGTGAADRVREGRARRKADADRRIGTRRTHSRPAMLT